MFFISSIRAVICSKLSRTLTRIIIIPLIIFATSIAAIITFVALSSNPKFSDFMQLVAVCVIIFIVSQLPLLIVSIPIEIAQLVTKRKFIKVRRVLLQLSFIFTLYLTYTQIVPDTNYQVRKEIIEFNSLPQSFDGFKIVQISDIHIGSLSNKEYNSLNNELTEICNSLNPDIIALTGDIISEYPTELNKRDEFLSKLKAKEGKYFIYGNHDIGSYNRHLTPEQKAKDINSLRNIMEAGGFEVLRDTIQTLTNKNDTIYILGVDESIWKNYFKRYAKITDTLNSSDFIISLSHNPNFYNRIINNDPKITPQLTLAGHTHAMQMEFELFGFSWSPSDLIHKYSRGMYKVDGNYLYINRGIGYHAYRRIGSRPEITVIELRKKR